MMICCSFVTGLQSLYDFMFDNCQLNWSRYHQFICFVSILGMSLCPAYILLWHMRCHHFLSQLRWSEVIYDRLRTSSEFFWNIFFWIVIWYDMTWYLAHVSPMRQHVAPLYTVCKVLQVKKIHILPRRASGKAAKKHHQSSWNILTPFCVFISCHLDTNLVFFSCRQMLQTPPWWKPHLQMLQTGPQGTSVTMLFHVVLCCFILFDIVWWCLMQESSIFLHITSYPTRSHYIILNCMTYHDYVTSHNTGLQQNHALWQSQKPTLEAATPSRKLKESHGSDIDDVRSC